jgi:hypothetical protein
LFFSASFFDLAEEWTNAGELMMAPVLEQARRFRRDLPLVGVGQRLPMLNEASYLVDDRRRVVLLLLSR